MQITTLNQTHYEEKPQDLGFDPAPRRSAPALQRKKLFWNVVSQIHCIWEPNFRHSEGPAAQDAMTPRLPSDLTVIAGQIEFATAHVQTAVMTSGL